LDCGKVHDGNLICSTSGVSGSDLRLTSSKERLFKIYASPLQINAPSKSTRRFFKLVPLQINVFSAFEKVLLSKAGKGRDCSRPLVVVD
jgi:hypothetical protein